MPAKYKGVIEAAAAKMAELDAAGRAILLLRCDQETDIRRTVESYIHTTRYVPTIRTADYESKKQFMPIENIKEATIMGTVRRYGEPFNWMNHAPASGDRLDHGAEPALMHELIKCTNPTTALEHRLIFFPRLYDIAGRPEGARTEIQQQYLALLREISVLKRRGKSNALIVLGCTDGMLINELQEHVYVLDIGYPDKDELLQIIYDSFEACSGRVSGLEPAMANDLAEVLRGSRQDDVQGIINLAYAQHENPLENRAEYLFAAAKEAKKQRIAGIRGLRWIDNDNPIGVGGFDPLKDWLNNKKKTFLYPHAAKHHEADAPKGILLVGLPGCGKTHLARQTAYILSDKKGSVPLLQLDFNSMLGKWLGEAEANCTMALRAVESVAPAVLLVDEIEKIFGGVTDGGSNDAKMHIFNTFLDWTQLKREKPILVIATANKTDRLPPELKRKGRFDETFFSGVPAQSDCEEILRIHLERKQKVLPVDFDYDAAIRSFFKKAASFRRFVNGADIETIVNAAFCTLFDSCYEFKPEEEDETIRYSQEAVIDTLEEELSSTRSYFDNNLQNTALYWIEMKQLNFRDAGSSQLLDETQYISESGMFKNLNLASDKPDEYIATARNLAVKYGNGEDYDNALRYTLAAEICRQVQMKGRNGR